MHKFSNDPHRNRLFLSNDFPGWLFMVSAFSSFMLMRIFETLSLEYSTYPFALQVCFYKIVVLSLPDCGRLSVFLHCIVNIMNYFLLALSILACKKCLKVGVFKISIIFNTRFQHVLNPNMDIPITQDIILSGIMLYDIVLFFGAAYAITLFIDYFFVCQTYAVIISELRLFETVKQSFSGYFTAVCCFVCSGIRCLCCCIYFLLLMLFYWSTTVHYNFRDC